MEHPDFWVDYPEADRYQYNSIENINLSNALLYAAHYRTLDPSIGRWLQIDPASEKYFGLTPYNSMANNPFSFSDPDGDDFGLSILIGVGIGILSNGLHNVSNGGSFFDNWGRAAFFGGVSGALGFGIGEIFGHGVGSFGLEVGRAAAHGIVSGGLSYAQGGDFWQGFASGAIGSGVGSGIGAWGKAADWSRSGTNFAMIGGGALSGGIGSSISGGSFWKGFGIGATVAAVNHVAHELTDPHSQFKHWEKTDEVNTELVLRGLGDTGFGAAMAVGGVAKMMTGKLALPGVGLIMYGSTQIGFGIAQITRGFQGYRAKSPMNLPGAIDYGLGGSGNIGTTVDMLINIKSASSQLERMYHITRFSIHVSSYSANIPWRASQPPNLQIMPQDNTRVNLPIIH